MRLSELVGLSARLHARILHLDQLITEAAAKPVLGPTNPVAVQQSHAAADVCPKD